MPEVTHYISGTIEYWDVEIEHADGRVHSEPSATEEHAMRTAVALRKHYGNGPDAPKIRVVHVTGGYR